MRTSETRYRRLFETAQDGILILDGDTGQIDDVNPFLIDMLGYTKEEFLGKKLWEVGPFKDREISRAAFKELQHKGYVRYKDLPLETKDGREVAVEFVSNVYTVDSTKVIQCNIRDITERKKAEEEARRLATVIHYSSELVNLATLDGKMTFINEAGSTMVGIAPEEVEQYSVMDVIDEAFQDKGRNEVLPALLKEGTWEGDLRYKNIRTGALTDVHVMAFVIKDRKSGKPLYLANVSLDITKRKQLEERLHTMTIVDDLTGLYNRRGFFAIAGQQLRIAERAKNNMLLFFADLDDMKEINDALGHQEGDKALAEIASVLKETFRESDIIGRIGGDEFAVLVLDAAEETQEAVTERLRNALEARNRNKGRKYALSLSMGIAHYDPENPSSLDELMAKADFLMYEEKRKKGD